MNQLWNPVISIWGGKGICVLLTINCFYQLLPDEPTHRIAARDTIDTTIDTDCPIKPMGDWISGIACHNLHLVSGLKKTVMSLYLGSVSRIIKINISYLMNHVSETKKLYHFEEALIRDKNFDRMPGQEEFHLAAWQFFEFLAPG
ncbi:hypothetical protein DDZ13_07745 [Coraliomargarita sinensis]|uniref:Uncharacterized protein n=1 Tax=Coraliomargarita sinensis TaxID=2174842 RepID=A0A317ZFP9_9BACT|nr:hypothetical protein DDZ13_07745 [Coraliomargarita sinensis]